MAYRLQQKILRKVTDANKDKINREAYKLYISEEFDADRKKNQATQRKTKIKNKEHFFETVNEAQKEANEKLKNPEKLSEREIKWWKAIQEDTRKGVDAKGRVKQVGLNGFTMDVDGVDFWLTIKEQAIKNERAGTATHEAGSHIILKNAFGVDEKGNTLVNWGAIAVDIVEHLKQNDPSIYNELFEKGEEKYKGVDPKVRVLADSVFAEEVVVNFIEKFNSIDKTKKSSKTFLYSFGRFLNKETGIVDDLSTQTKIVSFISSFAQKINDGTFSKEDLGKVKSEAEKLGLTVEQTKDAKAEPKGKASKSNLDGMLDRFDRNPRKLISETLTYPFAESKFAKEIGGIVEAITKRLYDPIPADQKSVVTRSEYKETLIAEAATMIDREYKPVQNLDKFVSSRLNLRANSLATRLGIEQDIKSSIDTEEARQIADETIAETETEYELMIFRV